MSQIQAAQDECTVAGQYLRVPTHNRHKGETKFELEQTVEGRSVNNARFPLQVNLWFVYLPN